MVKPCVYMISLLRTKLLVLSLRISSTPGVPSMRFMALMLGIGMLLWNVHVQQHLGHIILAIVRNMKHATKPFILKYNVYFLYVLNSHRRS